MKAAPPPGGVYRRAPVIRPLKTGAPAIFIFLGGIGMEWIYLLLAGVMEVTWAVAMKYSEGFTVLLPSAASWG